MILKGLAAGIHVVGAALQVWQGGVLRVIMADVLRYIEPKSDPWSASGDDDPADEFWYAGPESEEYPETECIPAGLELGPRGGSTYTFRIIISSPTKAVNLVYSPALNGFFARVKSQSSEFDTAELVIQCASSMPEHNIRLTVSSRSHSDVEPIEITVYEQGNLICPRAVVDLFSRGLDWTGCSFKHLMIQIPNPSPHKLRIPKHRLKTYPEIGLRAILDVCHSVESIHIHGSTIEALALLRKGDLCPDLASLVLNDKTTPTKYFERCVFLVLKAHPEGIVTLPRERGMPDFKECEEEWDAKTWRWRNDLTTRKRGIEDVDNPSLHGPPPASRKRVRTPEPSQPNIKTE